MGQQSITRCLPSVITFGNALVGGGAILYLVINGPDPHSLRIAASMIFLACILDMVDGPMARVLKTAGEFGAVLDTLSDMISFGMLPAVLLGVLAKSMDLGGTMPALGIAVGAVYFLCALFRLARFTANVVDHETGHLYFTGLPSPAAAIFVACATLLTNDSFVQSLFAQSDIFIGVTAAALAIALLMASPFAYADLPKHYLHHLKPWYQPILFIIAAMIAGPIRVFAIFLALYAILSPMIFAGQKWKHRL
jgi:CDP-diacylglycerol--serine O-phosphatidyltransferase